MKKGDRVFVSAHWSSFAGRYGRVVRTDPRGPFVLLEGDEGRYAAMAFSVTEVCVVDEPSQAMVAGD